MIELSQMKNKKAMMRIYNCASGAIEMIAGASNQTNVCFGSASGEGL